MEDMTRPDIEAISKQWLAAKDGPYSHGGGRTVYVPGEDAGAQVWDRDTAIFLAGSWQHICDLLAWVAELEAGLRPFARWSEHELLYGTPQAILDDPTTPILGGNAYGDPEITVADAERARALLAPETKEDTHG